MIVSHLKSKVRSAENELSRNRTGKNNNNRTNQVNSLEMDSKWAAVLVSCSDSCFLLRLLFLTQTIFDFGVAAREPRDIGIDWCLSLPGQLFWGIFLERLFSPKYDILNENRLQNGAQMGSCWTYFSEKMWKWKSTFGLRRRVRIAYEPIPKSTWCDQKITKKTNVFQVRICFIKNTKMSQKWSWGKTLNMCFNWILFLVWVLVFVLVLVSGSVLVLS